MLTENIYKKVRNGEIEFFSKLSDSEANAVIHSMVDLPERKEYLSKCFDKLKKAFPRYAFLLTCDLEECKDFCLEYLNKDFSILFERDVFYNFLGTTKWGNEFVLANMETLILANEDLVYLLLKYGLVVGDKDLINRLISSDNFHIRGLSIYELLYNYPYYFLNYCPDVLSLFVRSCNGKITEVIEEKYASKIAFLVLDQNIGKDLFNSIKEFIFITYPNNILASLLAGMHTEIGEESSPHLEELYGDMTRYFLTSKDYKYELYKIGEDYIDRNIYVDFKTRVEPFVAIDEQAIEHIFSVGLGDKFLEFVYKYLEKSTSAAIEDLGRGSVTRVIRIGDYVIKCSSMKWDMADEPPQMFLFAKDYEYEYVRDHYGVITGALEVQKYYSRAVTADEVNLIDAFFLELAVNDYIINDNVMGMGNTPNLFHLDNYKEAQYVDERMLPEWFKKNPIVWIDMDMIHKLK